MTKQDKLKEMLTKRNPLLDTKREAVTPVDLYTKPQVDKTISLQVDKDTKPQTVKQVKLRVVKYTTHLKPATVKAIKLLAVEADKRDYEIVEEAIGEYLRRDTPHK